MTGEQRFEFQGADGARVAAYRWAAMGPVKAVLQISHGMGEHALRYAEPLQPLREAGVTLYAEDHRGHGRTSLDKLGDFGPGGFASIVEDMAVLSGIARRENPGKKLVLLGHSLGSFALQIYLVKHSALIDAAVLSGSAALDMLPPPDPEGGLKSFNKGFEPARTPFDWLSRDPAEVDKYIADPLCGFDATPESLMSIFTAAQVMFEPDALKRIRPTLPIYLFAGDKDPLNSGLAGLTPLVERYRAAGIKDVTHDFYAGGRHEMLNETNRAEVVRNLGRFIARVAST
ncbi:MAG: alpha/beta hydrolase [Alphaproteobacteria bacterium]|nr:alpha/beta hydrolase [Alphaproteobacteria bacterium]